MAALPYARAESNLVRMVGDELSVASDMARDLRSTAGSARPKELTPSHDRTGRAAAWQAGNGRCRRRSRGSRLHEEGCPPDDTDNLDRTRFFFGQLLGQDDYEREQEYHRAALRRHNRLLHGWGVATGFDVVASSAQPAEVVVFPGYALDRCGREVMLTEAVTIAVPGGCACFVVARAIETPVSRGIVRDDVEISIASDPGTAWTVLASVELGNNQVLVDTTVRRLLSGE